MVLQENWNQKTSEIFFLSQTLLVEGVERREISSWIGGDNHDEESDRVSKTRGNEEG